MDDFVHPLGQQGRYRLVALSRQPPYSADDVRAYAVTTRAGDCLREEPTRSGALQWIDERIDRDAASMPPRPRRR
ncbi:hypothetical protein [Cognatiluteimonas telluris]|uniref:hypothetical protein n=1 Tax=Cognatiluteimonas telluris TaxID=1104775 RepID=UPI001407BE1D|nr:hypothetical protein [Lysobacter telluris]